MAADRLDLLGDVAGAAPLGALEGHVFEEMRDAVLVVRLVRLPTSTQRPSDTVSTSGMAWLTTLKPLASSDRSTLMRPLPLWRAQACRRRACCRR